MYSVVPNFFVGRSGIITITVNAPSLFQLAATALESFQTIIGAAVNSTPAAMALESFRTIIGAAVDSTPAVTA
jgi:hypothetical protein